MPEGPEHFKAAQCINQWSQGRVFKGKILKSEINTKNPEIELDIEKYTLSAQSRGKELMLSIYKPVKLIEQDQKSVTNIAKSEDSEECDSILSCCVVFQFGMSGCFQFTTVQNLNKHAHLMFYTDDEEPMVLSYVDVRRFGNWRVSGTFSEDRGPDPVTEYPAFRENVLGSLEKRIFQRAICEVMHNQKYFNGIGNYLRAEVLYRAGIPPFEKAYDVLKGLDIDQKEPERKNIGNNGSFDLLEWCSVVPFEVCMLKGAGYDPSAEGNDYNIFKEWLQCYSQPCMMNLIDKDKRTIWFKGPPGPLSPKAAVSRHGISKTKQKIKEEKKPTKKTKPQKRKADLQEKESVKPKKPSKNSPNKIKKIKTSKQGIRCSARLKMLRSLTASGSL